MQEASDRLDLAAAGRQHATGYAHQVSDIGNAASLSDLVAMQVSRVDQSIIEGFGKSHQMSSYESVVIK